MRTLMFKFNLYVVVGSLFRVNSYITKIQTHGINNEVLFRKLNHPRHNKLFRMRKRIYYSGGDSPSARI